MNLLWAVNILAREVTKWNVACDKRLHRLISYIHYTQDWVLKKLVGDKPEDCRIAAFCDASFVAELRDSKSSTGGYIALVGPRAFVPSLGPAKMQGATSHSSTEAEVIAMEAVLRCEAIPSMIMWELVIDVMHPAKENTKMSAPSTSPLAKREVTPRRGEFKMDGEGTRGRHQPYRLGTAGRKSATRGVGRQRCCHQDDGKREDARHETYSTHSSR